MDTKAVSARKRMTRFDGEAYDSPETIRYAANIARRTANALYINPANREDLVQEGLIGLVYAGRRYDEARGTRLTTYVTPRVQGAVRDCVGNFDLVRWRRTVDGQRGNFPQFVGAESLQEEPDIYRDNPEQALLRAHEQKTIRQAIAGLPVQQQQLYQLLFVQGLTGQEAGQQMGLSRSWISRLRKELLKNVAANLQTIKDSGVPLKEEAALETFEPQPSLPPVVQKSGATQMPVVLLGIGETIPGVRYRTLNRLFPLFWETYGQSFQPQCRTRYRALGFVSPNALSTVLHKLQGVLFSRVSYGWWKWVPEALPYKWQQAIEAKKCSP